MHISKVMRQASSIPRFVLEAATGAATIVGFRAHQAVQNVFALPNPQIATGASTDVAMDVHNMRAMPPGHFLSLYASLTFLFLKKVRDQTDAR